MIVAQVFTTFDCLQHNIYIPSLYAYTEWKYSHVYEAGGGKATLGTCPSKDLKSFLLMSVQGMETRAFTRINNALCSGWPGMGQYER